MIRRHPPRTEPGRCALACLARQAMAVGLACASVGCATSPTPGDPHEDLNRFTYGVNEQIDRFALKPLSDTYRFIFPVPVRDGLGNAFSNLREPNAALNNLLQGKTDRAGQSALRFIVNSTLGLAGVFDVATGMGLVTPEEDFGQTLAVWGYEQGDYLVLPVFGPSTTRDLWRIPVQVVSDPLFFVDLPLGASVGLGTTRAADQRMRHDADIRARDEAAIDPYTFTREGYLQRRLFEAHDGDPPIDAYDQDLLDESPQSTEPEP